MNVSKIMSSGRSIIIAKAVTIAYTSFFLSPLFCFQDMMEPGVLVGNELLAKKLFVSLADQGEVTDIRIGRLTSEGPDELIVVASLGYVVLDPITGRTQRSVRFEPTWSRVIGDKPPYLRRLAVDIDRDGTLEFITLGRFASRVSIHCREGGIVWMYPGDEVAFGSHSIDSVHVHSPCDDAAAKVLITADFGRTIVLLDHSGELVWRREVPAGQAGSWPVRGELVSLDVNGNGKKEILYVDGVSLVARDTDWNIVFRIDMSEYGFSNFLCLVDGYAGPSERDVLIGYYSGTGGDGTQVYRLVDLPGRALGKKVAWEDVELYRVVDSIQVPGEGAMYVHLETAKQYARTAGYSASRLRFRLVDARRTVVYEEILAPSSGPLARSNGAMVVLPDADKLPTRILIGYGDSIWIYSFSL